jgi:hypothetical protein
MQPQNCISSIRMSALQMMSGCELAKRVVVEILRHLHV